MIKLFALIAVLNGQEYIVDSGLSQSDCHKSLQETLEVEVWDGIVINADNIVLYCIDEKELEVLENV